MISAPLAAQNRTESCGFDSEMYARNKADPAFEARIFGADRILKSDILHHRNVNSRADTQVIRIPVAFHIMHQLGLENIPDQLVQLELDRINDAFRNRGFFDQGKGVDMHIEFCLATVDPQGQATNGIEHIFSPYAEVLSRGENYDMRRQHNWDPKRYLNIYTARRINFLIGIDTINVIATAIYPNDAGTGIDAITIRSDQVGIANQPEQSSVMVHEIGHYLGLYHPYNDGCPNYDCMVQGDRVCDTPPDSRAITFEGCILNNNCATDADDLSSQNPFFSDVDDLNNLYMDYNDFSCRNAFTPGQRERIRASLRVFRPLLGNNFNCIPRAGTDLALYPLSGIFQPVCSTNYFPKIQLFNFGDQTITDFKLNIFLNNGFVFTQFFTHFVPARSALELAIPAFSLPPGSSEIKILVDQVNGDPSAYSDNDTLQWQVNYLVPKPLPVHADFENGWPDEWTLYNPEGKGFERMPSGCRPAQGDVYCIGLIDRLYYANGKEDGFYSPITDLSNYQRAWLSFDVAYSMEDQVTLFNDRLKVEVSTDCGETFDAPVYNKNRYELETLNRFSDTISNWTPTDCLHWRRDSIPLHAYAGQEVLVRFVYTKFQNGNPLFLNNIEINGEWGLPNTPIFPDIRFDMSPIPGTSNFVMNVSPSFTQQAELQCFDLQGREVGKWEFTASRETKFTIPMEGTSSGIYIFKLKHAGGIAIQKVIGSKL
jgi:hypothetical protein